MNDVPALSAGSIVLIVIVFDNDFFPSIGMPGSRFHARVLFPMNELSGVRFPLMCGRSSGSGGVSRSCRSCGGWDGGRQVCRRKRKAKSSGVLQSGGNFNPCHCSLRLHASIGPQKREWINARISNARGFFAFSEIVVWMVVLVVGGGVGGVGTIGA